MSGQPPDSLIQTSLEACFEFHELIYSRTDERGVITSGNGVFQRMAGIDWRDLIGAPHRLIRHPDMPKGFFHLFWSLLKQGEPAVGYVKNRRKDGGSYWVLAAAMPCDGGFFSVRLRPSSPLFEQVKALYARHRQSEQAEGLTPEASAEALLARLSELGFSAYDAFAAHALTQESRARNSELRRADDRSIEAQVSLVSLLEETLAEQAKLIARFADLLILPVNMRLAAARLEPQGGPLSQISVNYKIASEEIARRLSSFVSGKTNLCAQMAKAVRRSLILSGCARLQEELVVTYDRQMGYYEGVERRVERAMLEGVRDSNFARARASLDEAARLAAVLNEASNDLRRMILGLDTIRILARVESRKSAESQDALTATIDRIDTVQASISNSLKVMMDRTLSIDHGLAALRGVGASAAIAAE
ncbi:PAS domain-containing protein [Rhodobacter sp. Har01]|uniref:PAS domain-containing protein n=1 Tax=Rhodobacter sp. Har01 TaxID=2883999 RepID=UPI001D074BB5|nr:PAS domain-containing protein [Rhodobacter sp. Har01]MCB6179491.1 PAS domain-containing protein [Rhodobacter sp. Har01]